MSLSICFNIKTQDIENVLWGNEPLKSSIDFSILSNIKDLPVGPDFEISTMSDFSVKGFGLNFLLDTYNIKKDFDLNSIPRFDLTLVSNNGIVKPKERFIKTNHAFYNFYVGQGINRLDKNKNSSTVILPIAFVHNNANCVHNGILIFSLRDKIISKSILQISSETCPYLKFDLIAVLDLNTEFMHLNKITNSSINPANEIINISDLYSDYTIEPESFADSSYFDKNNISIFGLIDNENHYSSNCETRTGQYPLCDELLLPSYSLAKSIAGSISISLLQNKYKSITEEKVSIIPECNSSSWKDVSFENLLDMTSGHYLRTKYDYDENSTIHTTFLFEALTHKKKIEIACNSFPKKSKPGKKFVYRTSDTYILGTGLNEFIKNKGIGNDYFTDFLIPFFDELGFSEPIKYSLRTFDERSQPYTGWGMYLIRKDLNILSKFLHEVKNNDDYSFLNDALNPTSLNSVVAFKNEDIFYNNGFWSKKFDGEILGCKDDVWIPFMSGFGGITFALFPNGMSYYYFSDGYKYYWQNAVEASNKIKPFC